MASRLPMSTKQYGVTPPISMSLPTKNDEQFTESLISALRDLGQYESEEEAQRREEVLGKINGMVKAFVYRVGLKKNLPESIANEAGGRIFTFGSYRLGVHGAGADIDTLCVVPVHVDREDFFEDMYSMLKERSEVTELTMVPDAYVPVINFSFSDIPIDLVFARLNLPSISDTLDLSDNNLLKNLDERCVRSLNGSRVTDEILRLVPTVSAFRTALRCVKVWAKKRAIYSNIMGFFGGVAWAMIVARVCQLYPNALAGTIITKFFRIMQQWKWPQPVLLKQIEDGPLQVRVWNPRLYTQDKGHRMPIITPAYPSMCSTHNVTASTQQVMTREFQKAADVVDKIVLGQASWGDLFAEDDFFVSYKFYLQVVAASDSQENQLKWSGLVQSKLRQLVMRLEVVENIEMAHPYMKLFEESFLCIGEQERDQCGHGQFPPKRNLEQAKQEATEKGLHPDEDVHTVFTTCLFIGMVVAPKDPVLNMPRKLDISWPIAEFTKMVKMWDSFNEAKMGLIVNFLKLSQLPPFVYGDAGPPKSLLAASRRKSKGNDAKENAETNEGAESKLTKNDVESEKNKFLEDEKMKEKQDVSSESVERKRPHPDDSASQEKKMKKDVQGSNGIPEAKTRDPFKRAELLISPTQISIDKPAEIKLKLIQ